MNYVTIDIIKDNRDDKWLVQFTNDSGAGNVVVDTKIDRTVLEVNSLIDTYLRDRYELPLSVASDMINGIAFDLAICSLFIERFLPDIPDGLQKKNDNALKLLDKINKGEILLDADENDPSGSIVINERTQKFTSAILDTM